MRKLLLALAVLLSAQAAQAADNYQATAGSGLTFAAKDSGGGVLFSRFIGCDNTTTTQCWVVDASGRLTVLAVQSGTWTEANSAAILAAVQGAIPPQAVGVPVGGFGLCDGANGSTNPCTTVATVKAASTPAAATDKALVVDQRPGTNVTVGPYPAGAVPYTATATGTTAATTATLAGAASVTTYICGFSIRANATAAATGNATVTGVITATLNFTQWTAPNASGLGVTEEIFSPCIPASATNTSIAVVSAAPGTGGVVSVTAWGYKL